MDSFTLTLPEDTKYSIKNKDGKLVITIFTSPISQNVDRSLTPRDIIPLNEPIIEQEPRIIYNSSLTSDVIDNLVDLFPTLFIQLINKDNKPSKLNGKSLDNFFDWLEDQIGELKELDFNENKRGYEILTQEARDKEYAAIEYAELLDTKRYKNYIIKSGIMISL